MTWQWEKASRKPSGDDTACTADVGLAVGEAVIDGIDVTVLVAVDVSVAPRAPVRGVGVRGHASRGHWLCWGVQTPQGLDVSGARSHCWRDRSRCLGFLGFDGVSWSGNGRATCRTRGCDLQRHTVQRSRAKVGEGKAALLATSTPRANPMLVL